MLEWRPVPGFEHLYSVSNDGDVRRDAGGERVKAGRILKRRTNNKERSGYVQYDLCADGIVTRVMAHQLVCRVFNGARPSEKHEVAHSDGNSLNNNASNLRWATRAENHADKIKHGTHHRGENAPWAKLSENDVVEIRKSNLLQRELAEIFGVSKSQIGRIVRGERWPQMEQE